MKPERIQQRIQQGSESPQRRRNGAERPQLTFGQIFSFGQVLSLADEAVLCVDSNRRIAFCNEAASALWGWSSAEAVGMPFARLLPERYGEAPTPQADPPAAPAAMRVIGGNR